ncbi:2OG-Fe(II) oxygenase [Actinomadura oligospora]|uniref:2OG-Fe(II) oxygenase n=1 Tax=Actinomadura oligospora TaxID=111804 RepID=UPI0012FA2974|nr:2OG-Fe(II) oxygenase [Actinomadura oligospora]
MRVAQRGRRFLVIDDFLDEAALVATRGMVDRADYTKVDSVIAPDDDGPAYRSRGTQFTEELGGADVPGRPRVYREVTRTVRSHPELYGVGGTDWNRVGFTFWKYPAGSRLGWHNDEGGGRRGEFILFLHQRWRPSWGGELLLLDEDPEPLLGSVPAHPDPSVLMERLLDRCPTSPVAVLPRPNRLVLVKAGTVHQIHRVDRTAGDAVRRTLTGFVSQDDQSRRAARETFASTLGRWDDSLHAGARGR